MKKKIIVGLLSFALIFGLGTTAYIVYAQGNSSDYKTLMENRGINVDEMESYMEQQGVDIDQMYDAMNSGDWDEMQKFMNDSNINFGQMLPYMQKIHPNLDAEELKDFYNNCHGTTGASNSKNFSSSNRSFGNMMR